MKSDLGKNNEAIKDYDQIILLKSDFAVGYYNRGLSNHKLGNYKEAIEDYDEVIRLNPNYADAYHNRGLSNSELGNYNEAIEDYDEAIRLNPDFAEAYNNRGNMKNKLGRYGEAIDDYDQAILLKPDYAVAYHNRGLSKYKLRKYYEAIKDYDQVILLNPDLAIAYHYRAKCYKLLAEKETDPVQKAVLLAMAEKDEKKTKDLYDKQEFSRIKYAFNLINQKEYKHAIRLLDQIIDHVPDNAEAFLYRGICKENMNNSWGALHDYKQAIRYNDKLIEAYWNSGCLLMEIPHFDKEASEIFTKVIELDPNSANGYIKRAQCYRLMTEKETNPTRKKELLDLAAKDEEKAKSLQ